MSDNAGKSFAEFIKNIEVVLWTLASLFGIFNVLFVFLGKLLFTGVKRYIKQSTEQNNRISKLEEDFSDIKDRDVGRSAFTKSIYGLSERTATLKEQNALIKEQIIEIKDDIEKQNERCARRHEK